jgi:hypothetical protein
MAPASLSRSQVAMTLLTALFTGSFEMACAPRLPDVEANAPVVGVVIFVASQPVAFGNSTVR